MVSVQGGWCGIATRQEPKTSFNGASGSIVLITLGGNSESSGGHTRPAVELDLVLVASARLEVLDADERVVVALDLEGVAALRPSTSTSQGSSVSTQTVAAVSST